MSRTYCHTHSAYDCPTCADEILSLGIQADKDRIKWLEWEVARLEACAAQAEPEEKLDFEKLESLGWQIAICAMCGTHAAAIKPAQSVPVLGPPVAWVNINKHGDITRTVSRRDNWCTTPVYRKPKTSIQAAELERLRKAALLEQELETERMRLAACGVIALANTSNSAIQARDMLPEYWSASAQDCASAVDREMGYRSRLAMAEQERDELRKDAERYRWIRDPKSPADKVILFDRGAKGKGVFAFIALDECIDAAIAQGKGE